MASALLDQLGLGSQSAPAGGGDLPPSMPDPEPHLASADPGADAAAGQAPDPGADAAPVDHAATTEVDALSQLIDDCHAYMQIPTVQPDEKAKMAGAVKTITDLLAANQKSRDSISGANPALRKLPGASGA